MWCKLYIQIRKNIIYLTILIIFFLAVPICYGDTTALQKKSLSSDTSEILKKNIDNSIAKVNPALVRILVISVGYYNGREVKREFSGSGVIITKEGHVITNHHVVGKAKRIVCTLPNREEVEAKLIGTDPLTDIAIIKLNNSNIKEFPLAKFGDSSLLKVGDTILAMGSPFALSQSVTMGIVSNTEVTLPRFFWPFNKISLEGEDVGSIVRWIGHDAQIYGGNSGGPLVNLMGEIVGINEISLGISGAIPGNLAKEVAEKLIRFGKVSRSWIGLEVQPLFESLKQEKGVVVSGTVEGSPADKAGFLSGDVLLKLAGKEINIRFLEEIPIFNQLIMSLPIGEKIEAVILRHGKVISLRVTTQERENMKSKTIELKQWGITAQNLSILNAKEMKRKNKDGVLVTTVRMGGPCWESKPSINSNDLIVEVDGKQVKNVEGLLEITNSLTKNKSESLPVIVTFERKKERYLTVIKLAIDKGSQDKGFEVEKAWLPIATQVITKEIAQKLDMPEIKGVRITQIYSDTNAEKAGLQLGDIITSVDGESIPVLSSEDYDVFPTMIRQYKIGSKVDLTVVRNKKRLNITVTLEKSPNPQNEMGKYIDNSFEITTRDITFFDHAQEDWNNDEKGVLVEAVGEGGWASLSRLAVGDLIVAVNNELVLDVNAFEKIMKNISEKKIKSVILKVKRGIHNFYIEIKPVWDNI